MRAHHTWSNGARYSDGDAAVCRWCVTDLHLALEAGCGRRGGCGLLLRTGRGRSVARVPLLQQLLLPLGLRWGVHMYVI